MKAFSFSSWMSGRHLPLKLAVALTAVVLAAVGVCIGIDQYQMWQMDRASALANETLAEFGLTDDRPPSPETFHPRQVVSRPDPLTNLPFRAADDPKLDLDDDEQVLGIAVNDEARAYSLNILTGPDREIINDQLGGRAVMATWCHLCNSAIGYSREVRGRPLTFGVSGMLWEGNLVMVDSETGSLWSQLLGQAMQGELTNERLEVLPTLVTTWGQWKQVHPNTTAVSVTRAADLFRRSGQTPNSGLCLAMTLNGVSRAWDFADLAEQVVIEDQLGETPVVVMFEPDSLTAAVYERRVDGRLLQFNVRDGVIRERETDSPFLPLTGRCEEGTLAGTALSPLPAFIADPATWSIYHPQGRLWRPQR